MAAMVAAVTCGRVVCARTGFTRVHSASGAAVAFFVFLWCETCGSFTLQDSFRFFYGSYFVLRSDQALCEFFFPFPLIVVIEGR
jgi:hypothetical protein